MTKQISKIILNQRNYLTISKPLARRIGIEKATILSLLVSIDEYADGGNGWFYFTQEKFSEYQIKRTRLQNAIDYFRRLKLLKTRVFGIPAKTHYLLDHDNISRLLELCLDKFEKQKQKTRLSKTATQFAENYKLDSRKQQTNIQYQNTISNKENKIEPQKSEPNFFEKIDEIAKRHKLTGLPSIKNSQKVITMAYKTILEQSEYLDSLEVNIFRYREIYEKFDQLDEFNKKLIGREINDISHIDRKATTITDIWSKLDISKQKVTKQLISNSFE